MVMARTHFAMSGSPPKLPVGPISGPRPGPILAMAAAALAGGYAGVPLARWLPDAVVRAGIIVTGGVMTVVFAVRAWG